MTRHYSPEVRAKIEADRIARNADRLEDVLWLAETGENLEGAAKRLGIKVKTLEMWTRRWAPEARAVFIARQPEGRRYIKGPEGIAS